MGTWRIPRSCGLTTLCTLVGGHSWLCHLSAGPWCEPVWSCQSWRWHLGTLQSLTQSWRHTHFLRALGQLCQSHRQRGQYGCSLTEQLPSPACCGADFPGCSVAPRCTEVCFRVSLCLLSSCAVIHPHLWCFAVCQALQSPLRVILGAVANKPVGTLSPFPR